MGTILKKAALIAGILLALLSLTVIPNAAQVLAPVLEVTTITWNVIGLDHNNVTVGPSTFPVGARVCNTGNADATNVKSAFVWNSTNQYIKIRTGTASEYTNEGVILEPGECTDFYYEVEVTRTALAYEAKRNYVITASSDGGVTGSTPSPRELIVKGLRSQDRNEVTSISLDGTSVPPGGTMNLIVGQTYTIVLSGQTAPNGYEQVENFINFPNTLFQILTVETYYESSTLPENPIDMLYADACDFDSDPTSDTYLQCLGTGSAGGNVTVTYEIKVLHVGSTNPQPLNTLIYDKSGVSYHYNSDFDTQVRYANIIPADPNLSIAKTGLLDLGTDDAANPGDTISYTLTVTNTGNIPLTGVSISDTLLASLTCPSPLPNPFVPGSTFTCTGSYAITQADIDLGYVDNTATADSNESEPASDNYHQLLPQEPEISIVKTGVFDAGDDGYAQPGEVISYEFFVANVGNVTLTKVTVTDTSVSTVSCPRNTLAVGESMTCIGTYIVTQADIDTGSFLNTAIADSEESDPVEDEVTVNLPHNPHLSLAKTGTLDITLVDPDDRADAGDQVGYTLTATNDGNQTLTNVEIWDQKLDVLSCLPTPPAALAPGESMVCTGTYTLTQADIDLGRVGNIGEAGSDQTEDITAPRSLPLSKFPQLTLVKSAAPTTFSIVGETINYVFQVTNTGNVTLYNIVVTDDLTTNEVCPDTSSGLAPGVSITCTASYAITQVDLDTGSVINSAFATDGITNSDPDSETVTANQSPALTLAKVAVPTFSSPPQPGDTIAYSLVATNTGNITLHGVLISDPLLGTLTCTPEQPTTLAPDEVVTCTGSYIITQTDIDAGSVYNLATADSDESEPDTGDNTEYLPQNPAIEIQKTGTFDAGNNDYADPGELINYQFLVTNVGNVTLTNISVSDPKVSPLTCPQNTLGVGESMTCTGTYVVTQADIDAGSVYNLATADSNESEPDTGDETVTLPQNPHLSLVKAGVLDMTLVDPGTRVDPGDRINYTLTALNDGNQTLTDVTIVDPLLPSLTCTPAQPASLAPGESLVCTGSFTLTQVDINSGTVVNTASGNSDQAGEVSSSEEISLPALPGLILVKSVQESYFTAEGDLIHYSYLLTNTGNIPLNQIWLTDDKASTVSCPGYSLDPGASMTCTAEYTVTAGDVLAGRVTNLATAASGEVEPVTDSEIINLVAPGIGLAKRLVSIQETSTGTYLVTFEFLVENFGNVPLMGVQLTDDLSAAFPAPTSFTIQSLISTDFTPNSAYNGKDILELLEGTDDLEVGASGTIRLVLQIIPAETGPFYNTASADAFSPQEIPVSDNSQDGTDPDNTPGGPAEDNNDGDPTNNSLPTPISFGNTIFDPPTGLKSVTTADDKLLSWQVTWINSANILPAAAFSGDPVPAGTIFVTSGSSSGYPVPASAPAGSTNQGVTCNPDPASTSTVTTLCYYEGSTASYPLGRVIWQGVLGADPGATNPASASNEIVISFKTQVVGSASKVTNTAALDFDLNGDGDTSDAGELQVRQASSTWEIEETPVEIEELPVTGFAPGRVTLLPAQPQDLVYAATSMLVEIPALGVKIPLVGVPFEEGGWDVTWLGSSAGYLSGTAFPTWSGNSAITAHAFVSSGLPGPFANLNKLKWGDQIIIHAFGQKHIYEVRSSKYIKPDDTSVLSHKDSPWLTLLTCREYNEKTGTYKWRLAVQAVLVEVVSSK